jgi:hypothetical protein
VHSAVHPDAVDNSILLDNTTYEPKNTILYDNFNLNTSAKKNVLIMFAAIFSLYFFDSVKREKIMLEHET